MIPGLSTGTITVQLPQEVAGEEVAAARATAEAIAPAETGSGDEERSAKTAHEEAPPQASAPEGFEWGDTF